MRMYDYTLLELEAFYDLLDRIVTEAAERELRLPVYDMIQRLFEAADTGDALDSRQLRLAFLQRAMGPIAFARDFLQMLPQPFCRRRLGECVGMIGRSHTRLQPRGHFHMRRRGFASVICPW